MANASEPSDPKEELAKMRRTHTTAELLPKLATPELVWKINLMFHVAGPCWSCHSMLAKTCKSPEDSVRVAIDLAAGDWKQELLQVVKTATLDSALHHGDLERAALVDDFLVQLLKTRGGSSVALAMGTSYRYALTLHPDQATSKAACNKVGNPDGLYVLPVGSVRFGGM